MSQGQTPKDIILAELENIDSQEDITDIYNAVDLKSEEYKQKINAINIAANGNITYWFVNVEDPLNNPQQISITPQEITRFRLSNDAFLIRITLSGANADQIVLNLLNVVGNLYLFGFKIVNQNINGGIRTFTLSKQRNAVKDNLLD